MITTQDNGQDGLSWVLILSITCGSANVLKSPSDSSPDKSLRNSRRIIFPERVLGNASTQ